MILAALIAYSQAFDRYLDDTNKIIDLKIEVAQLQLIEDQITGLENCTSSVVDASSNVESGWLALADDMNQMIATLANTTPNQVASLIMTELDAANKEWGVVLNQAKALQPTGGQLESKEFKTPNDMIKAIQEQVDRAQEQANQSGVDTTQHCQSHLSLQ